MCITDSDPSSPFLSETLPSPPSALPSFPAHKVLLCSPGQPGSHLKIFVIFCLHCAGNKDEQLCPVTTFEGLKSQRKLLLWSLATWLTVPHTLNMALSKSLWFSIILAQSFPQPTSRGTLSVLLLFSSCHWAPCWYHSCRKDSPSIAWHKTVLLDSDSVGQECRKNTEGWPASVPHCL